MRQLNIKRLAGYLVTVVGVAMVAVSIYYLAAYIRSGSDADEFNLEVSDDVQSVFLGLEAPRPGSSIQTPKVVAVDEDAPARAETIPDSRVQIVSRAAEEPVENIPAQDVVDRSPSFVARAEAEPDSEQISEDAPPVEVSVSMFAGLYPGGNMNPRYWGDPHWAGSIPYGGPSIPEGFVPIDSSDYSAQPSNNERGLRMRIPAIKLDASVSELEILDLGDAREWSTPNRVVGHIPNTANPGEARNGWYFGHLDNFISNEGDIFRRLPEISEMFKFDPVDIFILTEEAEYMYRVTGTRQMHKSELRITDTSDAQVVLVTCWPFRVYDQRILVSASLIAVRPVS